MLFIPIKKNFKRAVNFKLKDFEFIALFSIFKKN